jgi:uncharacterized protein
MKLSLVTAAIFLIGAQAPVVAAYSQGTSTPPSHTPISSLMKPSFNCAKAHSFSEKLICSDPELTRIDYDLSVLYAQAKLATHNSAAFKQTNNEEWLWREKNCNDRNCVLQWYEHRRVQLNDMLAISKKSLPTIPPAGSLPATAEPAQVNTATAPAASVTQPQPAQAMSQQMVTTTLPGNPFFWLAIAGVVIAMFFIWDMLLSDNQTRKRQRMIATAVRINIDELATQQSQLVADGTSGTHDPKKWDKEKRRFIEDNVKTALTDCTPLSATEVDKLTLVLDYLVRDAQRGKPYFKFRGDLEAVNSRDYVLFCARILKDQGWKVKAVNANKPEGYLVASRKNLTLVAQCKPQSIPVGLDSVREAQSLQSELKVRKAIIISNAPFATAAQAAAEKSGALLLHHFDLSLLVTMVEF